MNHNKKYNHLGRTSAHRSAMLSNMAVSLIMHKRINTTVAKAKALKIYLEPIVTKSKKDDQNTRRVVFSYLKNKYAVTELYSVIAPKIATRPGGYLRILKTGTRLGDNAETCMIEFVDFNTTYTETKAVEVKKSRTRRSSKKAAEKAVEAPAAEAEAPKAEEAPAAAPAEEAKAE